MSDGDGDDTGGDSASDVEFADADVFPMEESGFSPVRDVAPMQDGPAAHGSVTESSLDVWQEHTSIDLRAAVCDGAQLTVMRFLQVMMHLQGAYHVSQAAMGKLFFVLQLALPHGNFVPSYRTVLAVVKRAMGSHEVRYDACKDDCQLYRGNTANDHACSVCGLPRYRGHSGTLTSSANGFPVPWKVFLHRPISGCLKALFSRADVAKEMPLDPKPDYDPDTSDWGDVSDSRAWYDNVLGDILIALNLCTVILLMASDGFPVFNLKNGYSVEPIVAVVLNLPPWLRVLAINMLCFGLIPGPKKAKTLQPYMAVIVDDLKLMYGIGCDLWNAATGRTFRAFAKLVQVTADMPGMCSTLNTMNKSTTFCCYKCWVESKWSIALRRALLDNPAAPFLRRTHASLVTDARRVERLRAMGTETRKTCGLNGTPTHPDHDPIYNINHYSASICLYYITTIYNI